ncbi:hypothetical protein HDF18_00820 [Mucilaginibacter sp. X5P1]|uniref:hypothetical protein n=1 Tax=Mucilaginibacter sp. X5P1 TaxID=2723088 RepID=UPI00161C8A07|nr:hypothetical protein [Mucilaginibacter sp. X5P1]MBB6138360.1 hypothetical protein [Mucilaginibacter sp. X5P1]
MKKVIIFFLFLFICSCSSQTTGWKELNLNCFKLQVPKDWEGSLPTDQEDSFVGQITGQQIMLSFDCSDRGYANNLIPSVNEYLNSRQWMDFDLINSDKFPFNKVKRSFSIPTSEQRKKYPKADYIAKITYNDNVIFVPVILPGDVKNHNVQVDSTTNYIIKTIWPKVAGKGMTGIYIHDKHSDLNFQMNGENLSLKNEALALQAFKTIKIKQ